MGTELLGEGGRLAGIVVASDLRADSMLIPWLKRGTLLLPARARAQGALGFTPGDWWINTMLAFRDGIIDTGDPSGAITACDKEAYAILLAHHDEISSITPEKFVYRAHDNDKGRYRLTSAQRESRIPVRVLRSHTLRSFWAPRAGIRYDGLYRVVGWSCVQDRASRVMKYDISFERLPTEPAMDDVLSRPNAAEMEDYKEFKRLRNEARAKLHSISISRLTFALDADVREKSISWSQHHTNIAALSYMRT